MKPARSGLHGGRLSFTGRVTSRGGRAPADTSAEPAAAATHEPPARGALALIHCGLSAQSPQDVRKLPLEVNGFKPQNRRSQVHFGTPQRVKGARGATF